MIRTVAIAHHLVNVAVSINDVMRRNLPAICFLKFARALASDPSVQCNTILSMLAPLRQEQCGLLMNCLITGFVCGCYFHGRRGLSAATVLLVWLCALKLLSERCRQCPTRERLPVRAISPRRVRSKDADPDQPGGHQPLGHSRDFPRAQAPAAKIPSVSRRNSNGKRNSIDRG